VIEEELQTVTVRVCKTSEESFLPKHLNSLYEDIFVNLNNDQRERLDRVRQFLMENQNVFSEHSNDIGRTDLVTHKIDTQGATPIKQRPKRVPVSTQKL
jgi:hypothetical protein